MIRPLFMSAACMFLAGCVTNTQTSTNALLASSGSGNGGAAAARPAPPPRPVPTQNARLAAARLVTVNKTTTAGATLMLTSVGSLNQDCTSRGQVTAKVVQAPDNGTVHIENGMAFPTYSPGDAPFLCNARKAPMTLISYRASPGFTGQDTTSIQVFFPDGNAPTFLFHIAVQ